MLKKCACLLSVCALLLGLFACIINDEVVAEPEISEVVEDSVSGEVSEEVVSEEISEEVSEEVVEEVDYSASAIMLLIDELIAKYPIENPEHIKATMLIANLDNISEEDLQVIFDIYGYDRI